MQRRRTLRLIVCLALLSLVAACAGLQPQVTVGREEGEKVLTIKAASFKFEPNNIEAYMEDVIMLKVENISGAEHNFTLEDPRGHVLQNLNLPPGKTVEVRVVLSEPGVYHFYCNKPFHTFLGMKGRIEVLKRQRG